MNCNCVSGNERLQTSYTPRVDTFSPGLKVRLLEVCRGHVGLNQGESPSEPDDEWDTNSDHPAPNSRFTSEKFPARQF
jgi:hypothetical protein